jgi:hypothetical protein
MHYHSGVTGANSCIMSSKQPAAATTSQNTEDKREKIHALSSAKECYSMKLELLTNATAVDDALRFVYGKSKEKSLANTNEGDNEESRRPDRDQLKEEQEEETGERETISTISSKFVPSSME